MRPPTQTQSALRAPLNHVLGTEANVRILRVLATAQTSLGRGELARRAALQPSGVRRAVERLAALGVLELVGAGPRQQVRWREHPLAPPLRGLFDAETARVERLIDGLKGASAAVSPPPDAVWIEGPFARGSDEPGDPLLVGVVVTSGAADRTGDTLRELVADLERVEDVTIEFRIRTRADLLTLPRAEREALAHAIPVFGLPPEALVAERKRPAPGRARTHADQDEQTLALAAAVATKLAQEPGLIQLARRRISQRMTQASPRERHELREWEQILRTMSPARLRRFLTDRGERATRLRQTMPFLDALSAAERDAALRKSGA